MSDASSCRRPSDNLKDIPKSYLKRYLRLTPAYAMAIYIFTYVAPIMVEGVRRPMFMYVAWSAHTSCIRARRL